ncbi:hypothetical protein SELMODRAFT_430328 [Selaginella moellendorffii]|uniref:Pentacotripeptide-repeat region of PRORP domain-containing protein n=1 Tax=Selaginella moellendorffii TaxID=88036 RepID=D8T923_SELML|nr:hypothetical protein SELMODRAFT_430328 [Selaginella moellendorffii]
MELFFSIANHNMTVVDKYSTFSIYNDMKKEGVKPDEIFFSALIDIAGHGGKFDCTFVLQEVEKYSLIPGAVIFSSLIGVSSTLLWLTRAKRSSRMLSNEQRISCLKSIAFE